VWNFANANFKYMLSFQFAFHLCYMAVTILQSKTVDIFCGCAV
jgi:hypothetical protein